MFTDLFFVTLQASSCLVLKGFNIIFKYNMECHNAVCYYVCCLYEVLCSMHVWLWQLYGQSIAQQFFVSDKMLFRFMLGVVHNKDVFLQFIHHSMIDCLTQ